MNTGYKIAMLGNNDSRGRHIVTKEGEVLVRETGNPATISEVAARILGINNGNGMFNVFYWPTELQLEWDQHLGERPARDPEKTRDIVIKAIRAFYRDQPTNPARKPSSPL